MASLSAQTTFNYYKPEADAQKELKEAVKKAKTENKHVFIIIGGNWCPWCIKLNKFIEEDVEIKSIIEKEYILLKINYSKENKNLKVLEQLEFPQRFGFPVLVVVNQEGKRIHTQNSLYLEQDKGYNKKYIVDFLNAWTVKAISPETYIDKQH